MKRILREEAAHIAGKQVYFTGSLPGIEGFKVYNMGDVDVFYIDPNNAKIVMVIDDIEKTLDFQQDLDKQAIQDVRNANLSETFNKSDDYVKEQRMQLLIKTTLSGIVPLRELANIYMRFKHLK